MLKIFPEPWMSQGKGVRLEDSALGLVGGVSNHISMCGQVELERLYGRVSAKWLDLQLWKSEQASELKLFAESDRF